MIQEQMISKLKSVFSDRRQLTILGLLALILGLGAFLRFYGLGAGGVGNTYYAAAVKSMLLSWKNFFFVAFEPGGSVSVDKPPLGFWVQAVSAYFLGVTGFALALPNALAGVFSILLVYRLLKRPFGPWPALLGALVLAVMPVAVVTERNNTIDGLLGFVLLLAAWAFLEAARSGSLRWLLLGAFIVGLGFNIKMLQAFLPLPAFYALYFFGARHTFWKKTRHLAAATALLLLVSFAWVAAVDLTPAANRPYVDSTSSNSAFELVFGHNGIERLTSSRGTGAGGPGSNAAQAAPPARGTGLAQDGGFGPGGGQPAGMGGGPGGSMDFGSAGTLRLWTAPLAGEASWLLPFALGGLLLAAAALWKRPLGEAHMALILWAGWLIPEGLYFTYSQGLMHAYYLIMLGAPLAGLAGAGAWAAWQTIQRRARLGWSRPVVGQHRLGRSQCGRGRSPAGGCLGPRAGGQV